MFPIFKTVFAFFLINIYEYIKKTYLKIIQKMGGVQILQRLRIKKNLGIAL